MPVTSCKDGGLHLLETEYNNLITVNLNYNTDQGTAGLKFEI